VSLIDLLLHPGLRPFEIAVGLVAALLVLEIIINQLGLSLLGDIDGGAEPDFDGDLEIEFETGVEPDLEQGGMTPGDGPSSGLLSWLGIGEVPSIIWLSAVLTGFGLVG